MPVDNDGENELGSIKKSYWLYLHRVWSISLRLCVGRTRQLTHSNKHIIFGYFEYRVVPLTFLNRRVFLTTFVI